MANDLNLTNRGVKTRSLIVLNRTVMPAILVECLFADSSDADFYNAEVIARAIVNGLVGTDNSNYNHNKCTNFRKTYLMLEVCCVMEYQNIDFRGIKFKKK